MTVAEFARAVRAREITSEQATDRCLANIQARNSELNAFTLVLDRDAREQARRADRELREGRDRGPLHGVPLSIKDLIDVRGTVTTAASAVRMGLPAADADAPAVAHLRDAGAVFVGKTNLHEFALGTTSEDTAFGAVRHPLDRARSAGGSSGGSAVSVVTGMALASVGTDTGGSIRIPAAACGIVGLKASYGEVAIDGVIPLSPRLDHVGPLAQSVGDAWTLFRVLAGETHPRDLAPMPVRDIRIKVLRRYFCELLDDEVRLRFDETLQTFRSAGIQVADHDFSHAHVIAAVYSKIAPYEAFLYHQATLATMPEKYTTAVRQRLEAGRTISHNDFLKALNVQAGLRDEVDAALAGCDALVLPAMPIPAPPIGGDMTVVGTETYPTRSLMLRETQLFNLTGHPAISIPCGNTAAGLPVGLQLAGHHGRTDALVRVALECERLLGDPERVAPRNPF
jgi:aspartyl-tRNA(Asn)/glutamyl-tRNA(Gln) amidotransferase subunit A